MAKSYCKGEIVCELAVLSMFGKCNKNVVLLGNKWYRKDKDLRLTDSMIGRRGWWKLQRSSVGWIVLDVVWLKGWNEGRVCL